MWLDFLQQYLAAWVLKHRRWTVGLIQEWGFLKGVMEGQGSKGFGKGTDDVTHHGSMGLGRGEKQEGQIGKN